MSCVRMLVCVHVRVRVRMRVRVCPRVSVCVRVCVRVCPNVFACVRHDKFTDTMSLQTRYLYPKKMFTTYPLGDAT